MNVVWLVNIIFMENPGISLHNVNTNMEENSMPSDSDNKEIDKLRKVASKLNPKIRRKGKSKTMAEQVKLSTAIANRLSECCDCYMLFGFDTNGNPILIVNSANNLEYRALSDLLMEFVNESILVDSQEPFDEEDDELE